MTGSQYDFAKIARARRAAGITQDEFAERMRVTPMTIWRVEHGRNCSFDLLLRISRELNLDWRKLVISKEPLEQLA